MLWRAEIKQKTPAAFFVDYHRYEVYDSSKPYGTAPFRQDFGWGTRTYEWVFYQSDIEGPFYAAVHEVLDETERIMLSKYCTCVVCRQHFWKFVVDYTSVRLEVGCLKMNPKDYGFNFSQCVVDTSRAEFDIQTTSHSNFNDCLCGLFTNGFIQIPQVED
jgi:hypothetical protein